MPDFAQLFGGPSQSAADTANSTGIAVSDASINTKGSWTTLISSTTYSGAWLLITLVNPNNLDSFLVDIGIGGAGAEQVIIPDLNTDNQSLAAPCNRFYLFPIAIPAGTRISARCASDSSAADTVNVGITVISAPIGGVTGMGRCETGGAVAASSAGTSIDPGATINTKGAWVEMVAATAHTYEWMCMGISKNTANTVQLNYLIDVGIGAVGSEVVVIGDLAVNAGTTADAPLPASLCFPCAIAAGSRVAVRCQCNVNTSPDRTILMLTHGVG